MASLPKRDAGLTMGPARTTDSIDREYDGDPSSLRTARRDVVEWLAGRGFDTDTCDRAALVVSELASNAIEAAPDERYRVVVDSPASDQVRVAVHSIGPLRGSPSTEMALPPATRGRGLAIVGALSVDLTIEQRGVVVVIVARLRATRA